MSEAACRAVLCKQGWYLSSAAMAEMEVPPHHAEDCPECQPIYRSICIPAMATKALPLLRLGLDAGSPDTLSSAGCF